MTSIQDGCAGNETALFAGRRGGMSVAEASVASRFHAWRGGSGRRFVTSVFTVDRTAPDAGLPDYDGSIVIPARRLGASRKPVAVVQIERETDLRSARALGLSGGADEWHVHLLAHGRAARSVAVADLRSGHSPESVGNGGR